MRSTITYRRGQVVVVRVPFTDRTGWKHRPGVIVSTDAFHRKLLDVILCPISSQPRYFERPGPGDQPLHDWKSTGLRHPSSARVSNIVAVEKRLIRRVLGKLTTKDLTRVEDGLRLAFGL